MVTWRETYILKDISVYLHQTIASLCSIIFPQNVEWRHVLYGFVWVTQCVMLDCVRAVLNCNVNICSPYYIMYQEVLVCPMSYILQVCLHYSPVYAAGIELDLFNSKLCKRSHHGTGFIHTKMIQY